MEAERISLLWVGIEVAGAGVYLRASDVAFDCSTFGVLQKSMAMLVWSVAVPFCRFLESCRLYSVLNSGVLLLPCRRAGLVI